MKSQRSFTKVVASIPKKRMEAYKVFNYTVFSCIIVGVLIGYAIEYFYPESCAHVYSPAGVGGAFGYLVGFLLGHLFAYFSTGSSANPMQEFQ